ncbi:MAG: hypothetical protein Q8M24_08900 [Pseudolabrys sp.]|nr:hypothetical protein [Pseudolabrys sp.]MDP2295565.1 hypothetical protein [Pseudolabrys sp.]
MNAILRFFIPVLLIGVCIPVGTMALVQPIAGDLTRIGFLPERSFGWNAPQPPILAAAANAAPDKARIVVVGDSFTWTGLWQSAAFTDQDRYISFGFGDICADIGAYMQKFGLAPDVVIVEAVERLFAQRFLSKCAASDLKPSLPNATKPTQPQRDTGILYGSFGAKYALGGLLYLARPGPQHRATGSGGVYVRPVPDGCARFSHADCGNALFLGNDELLPSLPLTEYDSPMIAYLKAAGVKKIIVMSIPNKTSIYLRSAEQAERSDAYLAEFARRNGVQAVPLHTLLIGLKEKHRDLYFGNDSHLSNEGMTILGAQIRDVMRAGGPR